MKILIFGTEEEEREKIRAMLQSPSIDRVEFAEGVLSMETVDKTEGYQIVWIITNSLIGEPEAAAMEARGVRYLVTRSAGTDHLDREALERHHILAANVPEYSPEAISEHTVALLLALLRRLKSSIRKGERGDFTLSGLLGRQLSDMTVGIIGAGRIGRQTMKLLNGFGCKILIHTPHPGKELKKEVSCVSAEELLRQADAVIFHCPLTEENYHMVDGKTLFYMKKGALLVNTARGGLIDAKAVLEALKSGQLAGAALDVYEYEDSYIRTVNPGYPDEVFWELIRREDVLYTAHTAFYTKEAVEQLLNITVKNVLEYASQGCCVNEIITAHPKHMRREDVQLEEMLRDCLGKVYSLREPWDVTLLKYSENYNWLIRAKDQKYVLRLCRPGYHSHEELTGEITWLEELQKTTDIPMAKLIPDKAGRYLSEIDGYACTMFSFLGGTTLRGIEGRKLETYLEQIGETAAKLHIQVQNWEKAGKLSRFTWDYEDLLGENSRAGSWRSHPVLTERQKEIFGRASEMIRKKLEIYGKSRDRYGLIHSDLNINNILVEDGKIRILDFDDCGYGWFLYDLSTSVLEYDVGIHEKIAAWLRGYEKIREFSKEDLAMIPTFIVMRKIVRIGWIASHMENDTVKKVAPDYYDQTEKMAKIYLESAGKEFWLG